MTRRRALLATLIPALLAATLAGSAPAAGQEGPAGPAPPPTTAPEPVRVDLSFDVGPYDPGLGDFPVVAVVVRGGSDTAALATVELRGSGDELLWSATVPLMPPSTRVAVDPPVAVGEVASAGLRQAAPVVAAAQLVPPAVSHAARGGGGSGQLALSLVLVVALVAIVFRTPLPSTATQRWTA